MKRQHLIIIFCFLWFAAVAVADTCEASGYSKGRITDAIGERIGLSTGDEVTISLGKNQGLIKGDIGKVIGKRDGQTQIGRCVVQESKGTSSICQIIESTMEISRGDIVLFDSVDYRDKALFSAVVNLLDSSVKGYPTHEKIRILIHEIYDSKNNVTQFTEKVKRELIYVASQKKRITPLASSDFPDFVYYPSQYASSAGQVKAFLRKNGLHMLLTGVHVTNGSASVELSFQRICEVDNDRALAFSLPKNVSDSNMMGKIVLPFVRKERLPDSICSISYKPRQYVPLKEDRNAIIKEEAGADPFKELNLKRVAFNIISPVDFKVSIDGTVLNLTEDGVGQITLSNGSHRIRAAFKRGYYSNESLLYASTREYAKDMLLELNKDQEIVIEIGADPMAQKGEHLAFKVYRRVERERHALKPIQRIESEKLIEAFVE